MNIDIAPGGLLALSGASGSGKSTLLSLLAALDRPTSGSVHVAGRDIGSLGRAARRRLRRSTAVLVLPQPADNLLLALSGRGNLLSVARVRGIGDRAEAVIESLVEQMELAAFVDQPCAVMSGGEQQRLAVACALVGAPPLLLADEPTGALDQASAATLITSLRAAVQGGATIIAATHDPNVIAAADSVVRLDHGRRVS
ncbi:MAG TPA: ATP-binding cassette domain-containing protein [Ilumatobacteraceae bacterium]|nr:ATP-binding cassette domain-containing protein [Ilumatobacteraceae bacterium]